MQVLSAASNYASRQFCLPTVLLCSYNGYDLGGLVVELVRKIFVKGDYVGDIDVAIVLL